MSISGSDSRLEYAVSNWLVDKSANNDIRMMFEENNNLRSEEIVLLCSKEIHFACLDKDDLLSLPRTLPTVQVRMILDIIDYYNFNYWNGDRALASSMNIRNLSPLDFLWCFIDQPTQWDTKDFKDWKRKGQHNSFVKHTASFAGTAATTTTTAPVVICPKIVSTEEDISNIPAIRKIVSNKEIISKEVVAAADEIDGANFQSDTIAVPTTAPVVVSTAIVSL